MPTQQSAQLPPQAVLLTILAGLGMIGPFSIDTMFPAFASMGRQLNVSELALQQLLSVYLVAFAAMSLLHGPISDAVGRKPVILAGCTLYAAASVGCALAEDLPTLLICRALQGATAGAGTIISRAMVRDIFTGARAQQVMSHIAMIFGLAPALAPVIGGWLLLFGSWHSVFWFLAALGALLALLCAVALPETHPPQARVRLNLRGIWSGLALVLSDAGGRRLAFAATFNFAGMFLYISAAPILVVSRLGLGEQDFWILFIPLIGGMVVGSWVAGRLAHRWAPPRVATTGFRIGVGAALANLAIAVSPVATALPWAVALLPLYSFGVALAYPILTLAMLDLFPTRRGSAASVQAFVQLVSNAVISGLVAPLLAGSMGALAAGALAMTLLGVLLWTWQRRALGADGAGAARA